MSTHGLLIIGASQAGVQLAVSLRALGYQEPITLLGEENHRPYQRPALSKEFLQGAITKESLIFRTQDYWDEHRIDVVKNERIIRIDKREDGSGIAHAMSGAEFAFDRLALTVGARARKLLIDGVDLPGVLYLRNADDALELKARVPDGEGRRRHRRRLHRPRGGREPATRWAAPSRWSRRARDWWAGPSARRRRTTCSPIIVSRAWTIRLGAQAARIVAGGDRVAGVELDDGGTVPADLVLIGVGVIPNTELAESIGLECDNGIVRRQLLAGLRRRHGRRGGRSEPAQPGTGCARG